MRLFLLMPALILGALAACGTPAPDEPVMSTAPEAVAPTAARPTPSAPAAPDVAAVAPPPGPTVLTGLTGDQVTRLIGSPRFRRAEDPAALWHYGADGCVLDLYLRADGAVYRVVHFEFRPDPKKKSAARAYVDAAACFAQMTRAHSDARG